MDMKFESDYHFAIEIISDERQKILIRSIAPNDNVAITIWGAYCFELPVEFEGISVRHAFPREWPTFRSKIPSRMVIEESQLFVIHHKDEAYFIFCEYLLIEINR